MAAKKKRKMIKIKILKKIEKRNVDLRSFWASDDEYGHIR